MERGVGTHGVRTRIIRRSLVLLVAAFLALVYHPAQTLARPPLFTLSPIPDQTVLAGDLFQYRVPYQVYDEACWAGVISFALFHAPVGMRIDGSGWVTWQPGSGQIGTHDVIVRATASSLDYYPCWGGTAEDWAFFNVHVTASSESGGPRGDLEIELTEAALNGVLASLTEVRGINFGRYTEGFVDAWWVNLDSATIDVLAPVEGKNRARISGLWTAKATLDLFIFNLPVSATVWGSMEGEVSLSGSPEKGYSLVVNPGRIETDGSGSIVPDFVVKIWLRLATHQYQDIPDIELNLGTRLVPGFTCAPPQLVTNTDHTALVLAWEVFPLLNCPPLGDQGPGSPWDFCE